MTPLTSPLPAVEPVSVTVLVLAAVVVRGAEKLMTLAAEVLDWSSVIPPELPLRVRTRLVVSPSPTYRSVPALALVLLWAKTIVLAAALAGAPRLRDVIDGAVSPA